MRDPGVRTVQSFSDWRAEGCLMTLLALGLVSLAAGLVTGAALNKFFDRYEWLRGDWK